MRALVDRELGAGQYDVEWDGLDSHRRPAASGIYLYRLKTDAFVQSKKMVLLK